MGQFHNFSNKLSEQLHPWKLEIVWIIRVQLEIQDWVTLTAGSGTGGPTQGSFWQSMKEDTGGVMTRPEGD